MLTRREEDILILEIEEKNTELLMEWLKGKEDKRDATIRRPGEDNKATEGSELSYSNVPS